MGIKSMLSGPIKRASTIISEYFLKIILVFIYLKWIILAISPLNQSQIDAIHFIHRRK
jgi:hypothetical protein